MITLKKYKTTGSDWFCAGTFGLIGIFGIIIGILNYNQTQELIPTILVFIGGVLLIVTTSLPLLDMWEDSNGNFYMFPNRTKYQFELEGV